MSPRVLLIAPLVLVLAGGLSAVNISPGQKALSEAHDAWERGDYISALNGYIGLLETPGGDAHLEAIALQTAEWSETRELTSDGRNPRLSPNGRYLTHETGLEVSRRTRIVRSLLKTGLTYAADGRTPPSLDIGA